MLLGSVADVDHSNGFLLQGLLLLVRMMMRLMHFGYVKYCCFIQYKLYVISILQTHRYIRKIITIILNLQTYHTPKPTTSLP